MNGFMTVTALNLILVYCFYYFTLDAKSGIYIYTYLMTVFIVYRFVHIYCGKLP